MATNAPPLPHKPGNYDHAIQTTPPAVKFNPIDVPPSQFLYLQPNDFLGFTIFTNQSPQTLQLTYRFLTPQGEVKQGTSIFNTAGAINTFNFTLGECWLISFGLQRTSGGNQSVITFAQALIVRDQFTATGQNIYGIVWQGFINGVTGNGWPGTQAKELSDGPGVIRTIVGTVPAAGADISETVPAFRRWTLLALRATLTTSATVANRSPTAVYDDGANIFFKGATFFNQPASTATPYSFFPSLINASVAFGDQPIATLMPIPLRGGFRIRTSTFLIQVGDQWTAPIYEFLEWGSWDL
jgi:hypothetical protein